jgi:hypothetical protein
VQVVKLHHKLRHLLIKHGHSAAEVMNAFREADTDGDSGLSKKELRSFLESVLPDELTQEQMRNLWESLPKEHGQIPFEAFVHACFPESINATDDARNSMNFLGHRVTRKGAHSTTPPARRFPPTHSTLRESSMQEESGGSALSSTNSARQKACHTKVELVTEMAKSNQVTMGGLQHRMGSVEDRLSSVEMALSMVRSDMGQVLALLQEQARAGNSRTRIARGSIQSGFSRRMRGPDTEDRGERFQLRTDSSVEHAERGLQDLGQGMKPITPPKRPGTFARQRTTQGLLGRTSQKPGRRQV